MTQGYKALFEKYLDNQCSPPEVEALMAHFDTGNQAELAQLVLEELEKPEQNAGYEALQPVLDRVYHRLSGQLLKTVPLRRSLLQRIAIAASVLLALSVGGYFTFRPAKQRQVAQNQTKDIRPGSNKAVLILSNGSQISLSSARNGNIAQQGGTRINKTQNGQVVYVPGPITSTSPVPYNMITTPRGGQYSLRLADGTLAMLDAASSIRYPASFTGKERKVEITGQVYFEVAHNAAQPFSVSVKGETIADIGTRFNINAYDDEPGIKTTLAEGSIKVSDAGESVILKPGQQAIVKNGSSSIHIEDADVAAEIAWKNGQTSFKNMDLKAIMRQVSRWYDVDIAYEGQVPDRKFNGGISRKSNLSSLLKILELNDIHFKVESRKIIVMP